MRVVVTRPAAEAQAWVDGLRAAGFDAVALPLIAITPAPDAAALDAARAGMAAQDALMFVSGNAVRGFAGTGSALQRFSGRAWAPGPGTAEALRAAGVDPQRIDTPPSRFDSEGLWDVVQAQAVPGARLLVVRGADASGRMAGREWLAERAQAAGMQVAQVAAYRRSAPRWSPGERALAQSAAVDGTAWLFSSSEAATHLQALLPGQDWSQARALATHPRIAQAVQALGFASVVLTAPQREAVQASLQSLQ
jgi:uroporphyrinogen-III synthase